MNAAEGPEEGRDTAAQAPLPAALRGVRAVLDRPERALLAVDFDGTLAPIVPDPSAARALPEAVAALARLGRRLGAVAVVTGRPADLAVRYGGLAGVPGLERLVVLGQYGAERWEAATGKTVEAPVPDGVAEVRAALPELLDSLSSRAAVEDKGRALAVHTRRTPDPDAELRRLRPALEGLAERHGLVTEPGRMVLELRPQGVDKGGAVRGLVAETGSLAVVYAGDDLGDLAAFDAVGAARSEGALEGVVVYCTPVTGERPDPLLERRADVMVAGPAGLARYLDGLADELG